MYTQQALYALRDKLLSKQNEIGYLPKGSTALFICRAIAMHNNHTEIEHYLRCSAVTVKGLPVINNQEVDFELAYNLLFGDISLAPLHINDGLKIVAEWRFKNEGSAPCTPNKI